MALHSQVKPGMAIDIGTDVVVLISKRPRGTVRVSIEAPKKKKISIRQQTEDEAEKLKRRKALTPKSKIGKPKVRPRS